jgi:pyruvate, water dikinase
MTAHSTDILWFKNITKEDSFAAGEKAVSLGQLLEVGFPIPDGFIVTTFAYFHFLHANKLILKINQLLTTINYEHPESVLQVASHIQKLILTTKMSDANILAITKAYHQLSGAFTNAPVLIHVSPTRNSSSTHAQTVTTVHGDTNLLLKIKQAWASLFTPEMIMNRHTKHIDHFQEGIALIIQKMVIAGRLGTMMTIDPVTEDKTRLIIEVIDTSTDHYVIDKTLSTHEVIQKNVAGEQQKISDSEIESLAELGKKLEKHLYFPQEINWAIERGTIYIVQTKPLITHPLSENASPIASTLPVLLKGVPASQGIVTGRVRQITQTKDLEKIMQGDIIVAKDISTEHKNILKKASGIITDLGGRTSHIALLAREWGIPAIVGTKHATVNFKTGQIITLDGGAGYIYQGARTTQAALTFPRQTTTHLYTVISDFRNLETTDLDTDGILLLPTNQLDYLMETLTDLCKEAGSRPVIYRIPDPLPQGSNPMIGFRGTYRLLQTTDTFKQELHALKEVRKNEDCKNLEILLPFVRSLHELTEIKHLLTEFGLSRNLAFNLWIEIAVPSNTILLDEFIESGIDGIVIDIDTLSMLLLGIDKTNSEIAFGYDALDPAILTTLEKIIKTAHKHRIKTAVYGETLSHHTSLVEKLVTWGVTSIAIEKEHSHQTRNHIKEVERRLVEHRHLDRHH